jgi:hypothetical protein
MTNIAINKMIEVILSTISPASIGHIHSFYFQVSIKLSVQGSETGHENLTKIITITSSATHLTWPYYIKDKEIQTIEVTYHTSRNKHSSLLGNYERGQKTQVIITKAVHTSMRIQCRPTITVKVVRLNHWLQHIASLSSHLV